MNATVVLAVVPLLAGQIVSLPSWVDQQDSFGHVAAFRVRADLHGKGGADALALKTDVEEQIKATLRKHGIPLTEAAPEPPPHALPIADVVVDLHVVDAQENTAVAWSFHVSQMVRLAPGPWAFAATWIVGDLIVSSKGAARQRLRDSLQPALEDFASAYLASGGEVRRPQNAAEPQGTRL